MVRSLQCPNCGASINFDDSSRSAVTKCDYCSSTVVVPDSLLQSQKSNVGQFEYSDGFGDVLRLAQQGQRGAAIQRLASATGLDNEEAAEIVDALVNHQEVHWATSFSSTQISTPQRSGRWVGCLITTILLVVGLGFVVPLVGGGLLTYFGWQFFEDVSESGESGIGQLEEIEAIFTSVAIEIPITLESTTEASPTPAFASAMLTIGGEEGTGPGFFDDTRWVGLDGDGNIYTADYSDGRVQVFDRDGNFVTTWNAGVPIIVGFGVGRDGTVYVAQSQGVKRFVGATGEALADLPLPGGIRPNTFFTAPDGTIHLFSDEKLLHFSADGNLLSEIAGPAEQIPDYYSPYGDLAVDGAGNRYIVGEETVYKLSADGRVAQTIGTSGDGDDQFRTSPTAVAVDGAGRIYVANSVYISIFDANGRFIDRLRLEGNTFDMLFDTDNTLVVMDRNANQVVRYQLNR